MIHADKNFKVLDHGDLLETYEGYSGSWTEPAEAPFSTYELEYIDVYLGEPPSLGESFELSAQPYGEDAIEVDFTVIEILDIPLDPEAPGWYELKVSGAIAFIGPKPLQSQKGRG